MTDTHSTWLVGIPHSYGTRSAGGPSASEGHSHVSINYSGYLPSSANRGLSSPRWGVFPLAITPHYGQGFYCLTTRRYRKVPSRSVAHGAGCGCTLVFLYPSYAGWYED